MNDAVLMNDANDVVCWYFGTIYIFLITFSTKVLCKKDSIPHKWIRIDAI